MDPVDADPDEGFESDGDIIEGMDVLHADDGGEVLELDESDGVPEEDEVAEGLGDMDLDQYDDAEAAAPPKDESSVTFSQHTGSVFCVAVDPIDGGLAVTGGEDDLAYVWNTGSGEVLFKCTGHKDSVTCAGFSHDAALVATGDMGGMVQVWRVSSKQQIWSFEVGDLEWLCWHGMTHVLLAGTADGQTWVWKVPAGDCKTLLGHGCACNSGKILPDGKRMVAGYEDGSVKMWDLKEAKVSHHFTGLSAHGSSVTCIACHPDNNLFLTGSTDVTARLYSATAGKMLVAFDCDEAQRRDETDNSVEAVTFLTSQNLAVTGTLVGSMALWDIPTQKTRLSCKHDAGITRLACDSNHVYASTLDGTVHEWDARNGHVVRTWTGHQAEILDFAISTNNLLVTASEDHTSKVFTLPTT